MTSFTPQHNIPYPDGTDSVVVHTDLKKAVDKIDEAIRTYFIRALTNSDDIFALSPGSYSVGSTGYLNPGLPEARFGDLVVHAPSGARSIWFATNDLIDVRNGAKLYIIGSDGSGSFANRRWREVTSIARGLTANKAIDVWAGDTGYNGSHVAANGDVEAVGSHNPSIYGYNFYHETQPNSGSFQTAHATHRDDQGSYFRGETSTGSGVFTLWKRLMDERMSPALNRHELLWDEMAARNGGKIFTGDAVPVALTFDDYPRDFRDRIMPLLAARGLPCTIGLSSKMYDPTSTVIYAGAEGTTWAEIDAWPSSVSIANHSATHGNAEDRSSMEKEIVYGLRDLRNALPNKPIYTFMQPSVIYDAGFDNGVNLNSYAGTIAGHMQLGHHAYVTGTRRVGTDTTCPMVGNRPIQGLTRNWLDTKSGIDLIMPRITSARAKKHGVILAAHADRFDKSGFATMAEITAFLDWLKAEQDAGRVKVLTLEQFAISQYGAPAPVVDNSVGRRVKVWDHLNNREQMIYGETGLRKLTPNALFTDAGQEVTVSREGSIVSLTGWRLAAPSLPTGETVVVNLPVGFRPHNLSRFAGNTFRDKFLAVSGNGDVTITAPSSSVDHFNITFRTTDPWPATLPGSAVGVIPYQ